MFERYEEFMKLATERYSVRSFESRPVEKDIVERIIEAGRVAPTACNLQPQRVLVVQSEEGMEKLRRCTSSHYGCALAMIVCADTGSCWQREFDGKGSEDVDASIVTTQMMLAAQALGIGSTWVMHFKPEAVREEFALPEGYTPVSILVMGYPAADAKPSPSHAANKPVEQTVFFEEWQ